jgi:hypothetical protein
MELEADDSEHRWTGTTHLVRLEGTWLASIEDTHSAEDAGDNRSKGRLRQRGKGDPESRPLSAGTQTRLTKQLPDDRGELFTVFKAATTIRERIEIKRRAYQLGYLDLVHLMLSELVPTPFETK